MRSISNFFANFFQSLLLPTSATLREDRLQVAFEQGAGVFEVLFGVSFGGGDAFKRFVEDADDSLLFCEVHRDFYWPAFDHGFFDRRKMRFVGKL